jgi:lactoylglutathione lyase
LGEVIGFFHGGITVRDLDKSLSFYRDGLGLVQKFDRILNGPYLKVVLDLKFDVIRAAFLEIPGGGFIELLEYQGIERYPAASRPCDFGGGHFCFYVSKVDELAEKMFALGYKARSESCVDITEGPNKGGRSLYLLDPDGYPIELFQRPADG